MIGDSVETLYCETGQWEHMLGFWHMPAQLSVPLHENQEVTRYRLIKLLNPHTPLPTLSPLPNSSLPVSHPPGSRRCGASWGWGTCQLGQSGDFQFREVSAK